MPQILAQLSVRDGRAAVAFYARAFGAVDRLPGRRHATSIRPWSRSSPSATRPSGSRTSRPSTPTTARSRSAAARVRMLLIDEDPARALARAVAAGAREVYPVGRRARLAARADRGPVRPPLGDRDAARPVAASWRAVAPARATHRASRTLAGCGLRCKATRRRDDRPRGVLGASRRSGRRATPAVRHAGRSGAADPAREPGRGSARRVDALRRVAVDVPQPPGAAAGLLVEVPQRRRTHGAVLVLEPGRVVRLDGPAAAAAARQIRRSRARSAARTAGSREAGGMKRMPCAASVQCGQAIAAQDRARPASSASTQTSAPHTLHVAGAPGPVAPSSAIRGATNQAPRGVCSRGAIPALES